MTDLSPADRRFLLACALILLPLCLLGYGSDNDTYTVLDSGVSTWRLHLPETSRNPGYWLFEAITYDLRHLGGSLATNLATLAIALILLWRFLAIARRCEISHPCLAAASLASTPVFLIAATATVDYLWSLLGIVLFAELLIADRLALAILPAAFAIAIRGANAPLIAFAILAAIITTPRRAPRLLATGLAIAILGCLPYIESWRRANHTFAFLQATAGPDAMWTPAMRLGRFLYKSLYLFGPLAVATIIMCPIFAAAVSSPRWGGKPCPGPEAVAFRRQGIPIFLVIILANFLLFLRYPIEISYLIPAAFFLLLILGTKLQGKPIAVAFLLAVLSLNLITPQLAQPNTPGRATAATLNPSFQPGVLIEDIRLRLALRDCADYRCYYLHFHPGSHDLDPIPLK
jgi:hypothetical protein